MNYTHFLFASYVFILLFLLMYIFNRLKAKSAKTSGSADAQGREKQLFALYQNLEDMLAGFEEYVESAQKEISGKISQAEETLKKCEALYAKLEDALKSEALAQTSAPAEASKPARTPRIAKPAQPAATPAPNPAPERKKAQDMTRQDQVRIMWNEGASPDEIARELGISRGEVRLILGIKKNGPA